MQGSAELPGQQPDARQPSRDVDEDSPRTYTASLTSATSIGLSPRWVQYSGISTAASKVAEALADLVTMNTRGDQRPTLDREFLAYVAGLSRADKLTPYLRELQDIGFLTVFDGGVDPVTGKRQQRRGQDGRPLLDHFEISLEPPASYVGPRNLTALHAQFILDRDAVYQAVKDAGKAPRVGRHAIPRTEVGRLESPQVGAVPDSGGRGSHSVPEIGGQPEFPQVGTVPDSGGRGSHSVPEIGGQPEFPQVGTVPDFRGPLQIDRRSSISEGEIEDRSIEPVPGVAAEPPATGQDERMVAEVRRLVRRIPWSAWADRQKVVYVLNELDTRLIMRPICAAIAAGRLTIEQAEKIGPAALGSVTKSAKPAGYVADAFDKHLDDWLQRITVVPPEEDQLPLPDLQVPGNAATGAAGTPNTSGEGSDTGEAPRQRERRSQAVLRAVEPEERPATPEEIAEILRPASNQG